VTGPHRVESAQNPAFKDLRRLLSATGIRKQGRTLLAGPRLVAEALRTVPERALLWLTAGETPAPPPGVPLTHLALAGDLFRTLDVFGTRSPLLVLRVPEIARWDPERGLTPGMTLFVPFQDPENVGAVIRSAVGFGAGRIVCLAECAHPYHPKALRASGGAVLCAPLALGPPLAALSPALPIFPLSREGRSIESVRFPPACGLLPGLEGPGLPEAWRKRAVSIPIRPEVESLNAAVATAVALFVWSRQGS